MLIAVYGTLRKWCRLNYKLGEDAQYVGQDRLFGYDMYHNGNYPYVIPSNMADGKNNSVLVEVWDVTTAPAIACIRLEIQSGYSLEAVDTKYGKVALFVYHKPLEHVTRILNGDFVEWCIKYHSEDTEFYNGDDNQ